MAAQLEFPNTIGPFTTAKANLTDAFNAFYRQHDFPKPNPTGDENIMIGMDPAQAGMGGADIIFGQLSPLHAITLDTEAKAAANIPANATHFAWAYPLVLEGRTRKPSGAAEKAFVEFGGYMYFDGQQRIVGTNAISPAPLGTLGLMFGRPQRLVQSVEDRLVRQGRFQEITLKPLEDKGATHFAWIRPGEFANEVACADGCFAYKFADGVSRYFPVVSTPVFTQELLQEELDGKEAWVVLRNATGPPVVEVPKIFDKAQSLEENLSNATDRNVLDEVFGVVIRKDGQPFMQMQYDAWIRSEDRGSLADPWIFEIQNDDRSNSNHVDLFANDDLQHLASPNRSSEYNDNFTLVCQ